MIFKLLIRIIKSLVQNIELLKYFKSILDLIR
jgi:hypothetical protein